ncbi:hypothetical protein CVT26_011522, partial [Gymnopilus dilepis]
DLIVDTGSSNTWVGADTRFRSTSTTKATNQRVAVDYGSGSFSGTEFIDQFVIDPGLVISQQSIGVASKVRSVFVAFLIPEFNTLLSRRASKVLMGSSGILYDLYRVNSVLLMPPSVGYNRIGPANLTLGTLSPDTDSTIPTVADNLFTQGTIAAHEIGILFAPSITLNGVITWGGVDSTLFTGSITFIPLTKTSPASEFWGIDQSITYAGKSILGQTAGIVDTGTTLILIADDGFAAYQKATGAVFDTTTQLLKITSGQFANLQPLLFNAGGGTFSLTPNGQIWPRVLNTDIGGVTGAIYLVVNSLGTPSGIGFDFVNGFAFLERFYSVFDTANNRVGFATTQFTNAVTN